MYNFWQVLQWLVPPKDPHIQIMTDSYPSRHFQSPDTDYEKEKCKIIGFHRESGAS